MALDLVAVGSQLQVVSTGLLGEVSRHFSSRAPGHLLLSLQVRWLSKHDEEKTQFGANQSKHGNPSGHNDQLGVVKDIPVDAYSGIGFYARRSSKFTLYTEIIARTQLSSAPKGNPLDIVFFQNLVFSFFFFLRQALSLLHKNKMPCQAFSSSLTS
ncbi:hypothetical protein AVEN_258170-1 [Araneus ventricosus]|uniref:Uncharacterized protein n=1 Tax=Araneus ventricosus TaxID=182803 RepID=A0A4Y2GI12_ARAVE|nr:hypothetical protein AVEN_258170-1 [Araneus ventricosus]